MICHIKVWRNAAHARHVLTPPPPPRTRLSELRAPPPSLRGSGRVSSFSRRALAPELWQSHCRLLVTTGLDPLVHAELQRANAGGSIRKRRFSMDCLA